MSLSAQKWLAFAGLALLAAGSRAAPQAQPGDVGLRHDIQVLADYGAISGPVTTWPLAWDAVLADLEAIRADDVVLPNKVLPTFERVLARAQREAARGGARFRAHVEGAEEPVNIRGFADTPREEVGGGAGVSWFSRHVSLDLNVSGVESPASRLPQSNDADDVRADGSQIALDLGNWSIGASTYDRWWGPGWDGSLILSNNARPIPSFVVGRNRTQAFETRWLSWLGPWDLQVMFGQLEKERFVPDAQFFGMRFNFRPARGLEIGISRSAQWCGDGRPCDFDTFWDLFWGRDNVGDEGTTLENEPGNQLAGVDVRWTNMWTGNPISFYLQAIGEDEANKMPSRYLAQIGLEGSVITRDQNSWRWFVEWAATSCDAVKSPVRYDCAYRNGIYQSGYNYYRRIVGHGLDNDARVVSGGVVVVTGSGHTWQVLGRTGELNRAGPDPQHSVSIDPADMASIDIRHTRDTGVGRFEVGLGFERREDQATGDNTRDTRGYLRWTSPPWGG
jgi:hypothetical protein